MKFQLRPSEKNNQRIYDIENPDPEKIKEIVKTLTRKGKLGTIKTATYDASNNTLEVWKIPVAEWELMESMVGNIGILNRWGLEE